MHVSHSANIRSYSTPPSAPLLTVSGRPNEDTRDIMFVMTKYCRSNAVLNSSRNTPDARIINAVQFGASEKRIIMKFPSMPGLQSCIVTSRALVS